MKHHFHIFLFAFSSLLLIKCENKNDSKTSDDLIQSLEMGDVAKIIKTRSYTTKKEFDKIIVDKAIKRGVYQSQVPIYLEWSTVYLDDYNNVLFDEENVVIDTLGNILLTHNKLYEYFDPKKRNYSKVTTKTSSDTYTEYYLREKDGRLNEIQKKLITGELEEKTLVKYNSFGQKVSEEMYIKSGLKEQTIYEYLGNDRKSKIKKKTFKYFAENDTLDKPYKEIYEYYFNDSNLIEIKNYSKIGYDYFGKEYLKSEISTTYKEYNNKLPQLIFVEGYDEQLQAVEAITGKKLPMGKNLLYKKIIKIKYDKFKNITSREEELIYQGYQGDQNDQSDRSDQLAGFLPVSNKEKGVYISYNYNENNDWVEARVKIVSNGFDEDIIVRREINYPNKGIKSNSPKKTIVEEN